MRASKRRRRRVAPANRRFPIKRSRRAIIRSFPAERTMRLNGSCHCGAVKFTVQSHTPQPYMRCYCSICRKTAGGGGYAINIMGEARTLKVKGRNHLSYYRAQLEEGGKQVHSPARRYFCKHCGSALFIADPRWKKWVYPHASAIDTSLP